MKDGTKLKTLNESDLNYIEKGGKNAIVNDFVYPVQTKEMRKNNEDPRIKVSDMLQGAKRLEGESFEDYKMRMKVEKQLTRDYLKGYLIER